MTAARQAPGGTASRRSPGGSSTTSRTRSRQEEAQPEAALGHRSSSSRSWAASVGGALRGLPAAGRQAGRGDHADDDDYTGNGSGEVHRHRSSRATSARTSRPTLAEGRRHQDATSAFYTLLLRQKPEVEFQPGAFKLAKQMSAQAALLALRGSRRRGSQNTAVIPEGTAEKDILPLLRDATKIPRRRAPGRGRELRRSTACPPRRRRSRASCSRRPTRSHPGITAHDVIKTLVDRTFQSLDDAGVAPADRWKTVVLASIVQREAGLAPDYPQGLAGVPQPARPGLGSAVRRDGRLRHRQHRTR